VTTDVATTNGNGVQFDRAAILRSLNLNPADPKTQALLLICERYNLDPVLRHVVLITGNAYVTRDGYLAVAHRSGALDGIEVLEQGETQTHYTAKVAVYRKDMSHPFVFVGRFPKNKNMAKEYGPEMAVKVAEVQSLRRAFNVTGISAADEMWAEEPVQAAAADLPRAALGAGAELPATASPAASPAAPPSTTRRRPPPTNVDPATGEVAPIPVASSEAEPFTEANELIVDPGVARAVKAEAIASGLTAAQVAAICAEVGGTNIIAKVRKDRWAAVEAALLAAAAEVAA